MLITLLLYVPSRSGRECFVRARFKTTEGPNEIGRILRVAFSLSTMMIFKLALHVS